MKLDLTIGHVGRLRTAFQALVAMETPPKMSVTGKLRMARNLKRLRIAMEPVEEEVEKLRSRLAAEETKANPESKQLTAARVDELQAFLREASRDKVEIDLETIGPEDIDIEALNGKGGLEILVELEGVIIKEPVPA